MLVIEESLQSESDFILMFEGGGELRRRRERVECVRWWIRAE